MSEPVNVPPVTTPPANQEFGAMMDILGKLTETVESIGNRVGEIEGNVNTVLNPPEPPAPEPKWKPKEWDEFPKLVDERAAEITKRTLAEIEDEKNKKQLAEVQQQSDIQAKIDEDFNSQLEKLEKAGAIPPSTDETGKLTRKELFAIGIKYDSPNLVQMNQMRNDYAKAGYKFNVVMVDTPEGKRVDPEASSWIKANPSPFGANAPVGSSSKSSVTPSKPTYKDIHNQTMDQMVQRFGG